MRHGRARGNGHEQRTRLRTCANLPCPSSIAVIAMPSFDIVSEVDTHELTNAVEQANRELTTRFDFKVVEASFERDENLITQAAPSKLPMQYMHVIPLVTTAARQLEAHWLVVGTMGHQPPGPRQEAP